ncbi:MAG: hypothetical protein FJZ95_00655 [Chloroflexi bacterium]|nr:hypothetical protein [Chloroflexota bacterium]
MSRKSKEARRARREEREKAEAPQTQDERSALVRIFDHIAEKGIYAIILFAPLAFFPQTFWPFDAPRAGVFWILTTLVLTAYLCRIIVAGEWSIARPSIVILIAIALYLLVYTVSTILSISPDLSLFSGEGRNLGLVSLISIFLLFFMIIHIMRERKQLMRCLQLFVITSTVAAILSLYQYYDEIKDAHFYVIVGLVSAAAIASLGLLLVAISKRSKRLGMYTLLALIAVTVAICTPLFYHHVEGAAEGTYYGAISPQDLNAKITDPNLRVHESPAPGGFDVISGKIGWRASAPFGNPDFLIMFIVLPIAVAYTYVLRRQWIYVLPLLLLVLCFALSIPTLLGDHRADYFAALILLSFPVGAVLVPRKHLLIYTLSVLLLLTIPGGCLFATNAFDNKDKIETFTNTNLGMSGEGKDRHLLRSIALDSLDDSKSWIIGSGPNTFRDTFQHNATLEYAQQRPDRREDKVHNSFMEALATTGVAGLVSHILMLTALVGYFALWLRRKGGKTELLLGAGALTALLLFIVISLAPSGSLVWISRIAALLAYVMAFVFIYWVGKQRENPDILLVGMILVAAAAYIMLTVPMFDEVIPFAFFWVLMAIGIGLTMADSPRAVTIRWNTSNIFAYCMVVLILAAGCFTAYKATRPLAANHYYYRAMYLENTAGATASLPYYKKAIANNPSEVRYLWSYGLALLNEAQKSPDSAVQYLNCTKCLEAINKAIDKEPESGMLYLNRAQFRYACVNVFGSVGQTGTLAEVKADISKTIELYPTGYHAYSILADIEADQDNWKEAIEAGEKVLVIVPTDYDTLLNLGVNRISFGDELAASGDQGAAQEQYAMAATDLERAIEVRLDDATAHYYLAIAYKKAGAEEKASEKFEEVLGALSQLVQKQPNDAYLHFLLGGTYEGLDNLEKAKEEYQTSVKLDPNFEAAKEALERLGE